jgi:hypothetical protein
MNPTTDEEEEEKTPEQNIYICVYTNHTACLGTVYSNSKDVRKRVSLSSTYPSIYWFGSVRQELVHALLVRLRTRRHTRRIDCAILYTYASEVDRYSWLLSPSFYQLSNRYRFFWLYPVGLIACYYSKVTPQSKKLIKFAPYPILVIHSYFFWSSFGEGLAVCFLQNSSDWAPTRVFEITVNETK